jgi:hypothetical protein
MNKMLIQLIIVLTVILLVSSFLLPFSCAKNPDPIYWKELRTDKEWMQHLNQFLSWIYIEEKDKAAFASVTPGDISPSLYTTFSIVRMVKDIGVNIDNKEQIAIFINSLRNQDGMYLDSFVLNQHKSNETAEAIEVMSALGIKPENIDATVNYLLSLAYGDGTFLQYKEGIITPEDSRIYRIVKGTGVVVKSLINLGQADKIPQQTKDIIVDEVSSSLGKDDPFNSETSGSIIGAVRILTLINPELVPDSAKNYISLALKELPSEADISFPGRAIYLLDIAHTLKLPEAKDENILDGLRVYLKDKIFPLQNLSGGYGPSETIEPMTTGDVVILANRLGIEYPNFNKLMTNINNHWVGNGWSRFLVPSINLTNYVFTYYGIEIADFSGFEYDKEKVNVFLDNCLSGISPGSGEEISLKELYYAVNTIKAMNGGLTSEENQNAKDLCMKLSRRLVSANETDIDPVFTYALPISRMLSFELPAEVLAKISKLNGAFKEELLVGKKAMIPNYLLLFWQSLETNSSLTKYEVLKDLESLYDGDSGGYTSPKLIKIPTPEEAANWTPVYKSNPELFQTYSALKLLSELGAEVTDKDKTVNFVLSCKQDYGFKRAPDWNATTIIETTFAGIMSLKLLSQE